jgi:hypothetical protein
MMMEDTDFVSTEGADFDPKNTGPVARGMPRSCSWWALPAKN